MKTLLVLIVAVVAATAFWANHVYLPSPPPATEPITFGASTQPIGGTTYNLSGSGVSSSNSSITLVSLTLPQTGQKLQDSDFSDTFYVTLEPGSRTRQEFVSCTVVTQNGNGTATLSSCTRGLSPITPYTASSTLQFSHAGGSQVIFSDPPQLFNEFAAKMNNEWITGTWGFGSHVPTTTAPCVTAGQLCNYESLAALSLAGAATSTETILGLSVITPTSVVGSSTASTTPGLFGGAPYVLLNKFATTTPGTLCTSNQWKCIVATNAGKIAQAFYDLTAAFNWSGQHTFSSSGAGTGIFSTNASSTNATTTTTWALGTTNMRVPQSGPAASSSILALSGTSPYQLSYVQQGAVLCASSAFSGSSNAASTTLASCTIPANTLNTNNILRAYASFDIDSAASCAFHASFGNGTATDTPLAIITSTGGTMNITISATTTNRELVQGISNRNGAANVNLPSPLSFATLRYASTTLSGTSYLSFNSIAASGGPCVLSGYSVEVLYQR